MAPRFADWPRIRCYASGGGRWARPVTRSIALGLLVLGAFSMAAAIVTMAVQQMGTDAELYVSGFSVLWLSFQFSGLAWAPAVAVLAALSLSGALLHVERRSDAGLLLGSIGWLVLSVASPPVGQVNGVLCIATAGFAIVWLAAQLPVPNVRRSSSDG